MTEESLENIANIVKSDQENIAHENIDESKPKKERKPFVMTQNRLDSLAKAREKAFLLREQLKQKEKPKPKKMSKMELKLQELDIEDIEEPTSANVENIIEEKMLNQQPKEEVQPIKTEPEKPSFKIINGIYFI